MEPDDHTTPPGLGAARAEVGVDLDSLRGLLDKGGYKREHGSKVGTTVAGNKEDTAGRSGRAFNSSKEVWAKGYRERRTRAVLLQ